MDFPFKIRSVIAGSMSMEKGVHRGDCLITVNGKKTEKMKWDDLRTELMIRPAIVEFQRPQEPPSTASMWNIAAGLVRGDKSPTSEREELKNIIHSLGGSDIEGLKMRAQETERMTEELVIAKRELESLLEEKETLKAALEDERLKNSNLSNLVDETESRQQEIIAQFQNQLVEKDRLIGRLGTELENVKMDFEKISSEQKNITPQSASVDALKDQLSTYESRIELIEKDNTRLRKENTDLGIMVQQCLEKIQRDLADKPHWVDRRVVCSSIATLLKEMDSIDESSGTAIELHASARQRLGDVLGLTFEERNSMGLLHVPQVKNRRVRGALGEDFVTFLERETATDNSHIADEISPPTSPAPI